MLDLRFTKMQACGNDFVIVDDRIGALVGMESEVSQRVCQRRLGIGADGLLILRNGSQAGYFRMVFVNSNGLIGEMCGNGARCLSAHIQRLGLADKALVLETGNGLVHVQFLDNQRIELTLPAAGPVRTDVAIQWGGRQWLFDAVDIGPPHAVCFVDTVADLAALDVPRIGSDVRHHAAFAPRGCNVNFAAVEGEVLHVRTFERGVEDETLGCGTGATATVLVARLRWGASAPTVVITRSEEELDVALDDPTGSLKLTGGAHLVADGTLSPALLRGLVSRSL